MNVISNILYWISTGLLVPVIVLLIFFFIRSLLLIGTFFGQYVQHKKASATINSQIKNLTPETFEDFQASLPAKATSLEMVYIKKIMATDGDDAKIDLLLSELLLSDKRF